MSSGVGEIIEVMMAKSPDDRYPSMMEVISDLEAVTNGEPPFQARKKYDHELLQTLATGSTMIDEANAEALEIESDTPRVSAHWVLALGVLLAISVLCNVLLFFRG